MHPGGNLGNIPVRGAFFNAASIGPSPQLPTLLPGLLVLLRLLSGLQLGLLGLLILLVLLVFPIVLKPNGWWST